MDFVRPIEAIVPSAQGRVLAVLVEGEVILLVDDDAGHLQRHARAPGEVVPEPAFARVLKIQFEAAVESPMYVKQPPQV